MAHVLDANLVTYFFSGALASAFAFATASIIAPFRTGAGAVASIIGLVAAAASYFAATQHQLSALIGGVLATIFAAVLYRAYLERAGLPNRGTPTL